MGGSDEDNRNPLVGLLVVLLAPFAAMIIQMAVSRSREFLADEHSATVLHGGTHLASALKKLANFKQAMPPIQPSPADQATAHLMFTNMFSAAGLASLFSTHPSTEARIARLERFM